MLELVLYPADILRTRVKSVEEVTPQLLEQTEQMLQIMDAKRGIGLAGPQVGLDTSLFVVGLPDQKPLVFINPEIILSSEDLEPYEEGCLSLPGIYAKVNRPSQISIQALNQRGRPFRLDADGLLARVIQHEMDHLAGVLFIDYLSEFKRERLMKEYSKLGKV